MLRTINPAEYDRWVDTIQTGPMPLSEDELDLANQEKRDTIDRMLRQRTGASAGTWLPGCKSDACRSGRMACPTPYSCLVPVSEDAPRVKRQPIARAARLRRAFGTVAVMTASASITIWLLVKLAGVAP